MPDLFNRVVIGSYQRESVRSRWPLQTIPRPMSGGLFKAETIFKSPTVVHCVTPFTTEFAEIDISGDFFSPADVFFDNDLLEMVFISRDVNNNNSGISYMIWLVSDWVVIGLDNCTRGGWGNGQW